MRILRSDALDELRFDHRGCRLLAVEDRLNCDANSVLRLPLVKQRNATASSIRARRVPNWQTTVKVETSSTTAPP
jgi:hypothetical protein